MTLLELKEHLDDMPDRLLNKGVKSIKVLASINGYDSLDVEFIEHKTIVFDKDGFKDD